MKRIFQLLLIVIVALVAAYYFLVDGFIKSAIEREGSNALKAQLDIGSVRFHLFPTAITLYDVAATNPRAPMSNLVSADAIHADIDLRQVLDHRIVVDRAVLNGLRFNQPRARSGAIAGLTPAPTPTASGSALPGIALPDVKQLADDAKTHLQGELGQIEQSLQQINSDWKTRLQQLPNKQTLDAYRERAKALKQLNTVQRLVGVEQLHRDLKAELDTLKDSETKLRSDWQQVNQLVGRARALPDAELTRLLASAGLDRTQFNNLTQTLLAGKLAPIVEQVAGLAGVQMPAATSDGDSAAANRASEPEWLMLARRIDLDGELQLGQSRLPFNGQIDNVTPQPAVWNLPLTFSLSGASQFTANGTLDYRQAINGQVQLALDRFPIAALALADNKELSVALERALASARGVLALRNGEIDLELSSQFRDAALTVSAGDNHIARRIAELLRDVHQLDLQMRVRGRPDSPQVRISSNLDQLLAGALGSEAQKQAAQLAGKLREELQAKLGPQLAEIQQQTSTFNAVQEQLLQHREALQQLSGNLLK